MHLASGYGHFKSFKGHLNVNGHTLLGSFSKSFRATLQPLSASSALGSGGPESSTPTYKCGVLGP